MNILKYVKKQLKCCQRLNNVVKGQKNLPKKYSKHVSKILSCFAKYSSSLVALVLELFPRRYQPSEQLAPFLYQDILDILYVLMSRHLNRVILASATISEKEFEC